MANSRWAILPLGPHTAFFGEWFDKGKAPEGVEDKTMWVLISDF